MPLDATELRRRLSIAKLALLVQLENILAMEAALNGDAADSDSLFDSERLIEYLEKSR